MTCAHSRIASCPARISRKVKHELLNFGGRPSYQLIMIEEKYFWIHNEYGYKQPYLFFLSIFQIRPAGYCTEFVYPKHHYITQIIPPSILELPAKLKYYTFSKTRKTQAWCNPIYKIAGNITLIFVIQH